MGIDNRFLPSRRRAGLLHAGDDGDAERARENHDVRGRAGVGQDEPVQQATLQLKELAQAQARRGEHRRLGEHDRRLPVHVHAELREQAQADVLQVDGALAQIRAARRFQPLRESPDGAEHRLRRRAATGVELLVHLPQKQGIPGQCECRPQDVPLRRVRRAAELPFEARGDVGEGCGKPAPLYLRLHRARCESAAGRRKPVAATSRPMPIPGLTGVPASQDSASPSSTRGSLTALGAGASGNGASHPGSTSAMNALSAANASASSTPSTQRRQGHRAARRR